MFKKYDRFFAFGCSFTQYFWPTWVQVLAYDLDVPFYNYGCIGAGNQYISNMLVQADQIYKFNTNDLIIVCWTNVCREDKWVNGNWITAGNIFTQGKYSRDYVEKFADPTGYLIRDLATIKLTKRLLDYTHCDYYFLSMADLPYWLSQYEKNDILTIQQEVISLYQDVLNTCCESFYKILYNDDLSLLHQHYDAIFNKKFVDYHPLPLQHFEYLKQVFKEHSFKNTTFDKVKVSNNTVIDYIKPNTQYKNIHEFTHSHRNELYELSLIKRSESIKYY